MTPIPKPDKPIRMVVCAANRVVRPGAPLGDPELTEFLVCGPRHYDPTMRAQIKAFVSLGHDPAWWRVAAQGFIDQWGVFMTREEAWVVALAAGQVRYGPHLSGGQLDSSDLF